MDLFCMVSLGRLFISFSLFFCVFFIHNHTLSLSLPSSLSFPPLSLSLFPSLSLSFFLSLFSLPLSFIFPLSPSFCRNDLQKASLAYNEVKKLLRSFNFWTKKKGLREKLQELGYSDSQVTYPQFLKVLTLSLLSFPLSFSFSLSLSLSLSFFLFLSLSFSHKIFIIFVCMCMCMCVRTCVCVCGASLADTCPAHAS